MPDYKKILRYAGERFGRKRLVSWAIAALVLLFLVALILDGAIFFRYYRIAVESPTPAPLSKVSISVSDLDKVLEIIGDGGKK